MKTASEIIAFIGRDVVKQRLGVEDRRIQQAARDNAMPASWYHALEEMAGRPLPRDIFSFKGMDA